MKIAFYIDPIIDDGLPYRRLYWLYNTLNFMFLLEKDVGAWPDRFRIVTNLQLRDKAIEGVELPLGPAKGYVAGVPEEIVETISYKEVREIFNADGLDTNGRWISGRYDDQDALKYGMLVKDRLGDFTPDLILSFSSCPFLRAAYPDVMVLNTEAGVFSTAPFPITSFYDPFGTFRASYLAKHADSIKAYRPDAEEQRFLALIRQQYVVGIFQKTNPFLPYGDEIREGFKSVWLWPTVWERSFGWDWDTPIGHTFDYLCWLLEEVGPDVGIVVSEHPKRRHYWDDEKKQFLKKYFPNFIIVPNEHEFRGSSQYLLGLVDGIISMGSMTGEHAFMFDKKLVTPCINHMTPYSDATTLDTLNDVAHSTSPEWRDNSFIWKLMHYYVPHSIQFQPEWLTNTFDRWMEKFAEGTIEPDFFAPAADCREVLKQYVYNENTEGMPLRW